MSETALVPGLTKDNAILLLAAAEEAGLPQEVVKTTDEGFVVPAEVAAKAFPQKSTKSSKRTTTHAEA